MNKKIPVIIDCDPGHDDAIAIMLAKASDKLDILAISIVGGNQTLTKTTENAIKVLEVLGADTPVAVGAAKPMFADLAPYIKSTDKNEADGYDLNSSKIKPVGKNCYEFLAEKILSSKEKVTLIPCGPLTNIAILFLTYPEVLDNIERISLMGGGAYYGNITPMAEFNIWQDPEAADIVFRSGIPITMHGICTTRMAHITQNDIESWRELSIGGRFAAELMDAYTMQRKDKNIPIPIHDANAVAWVIDPDIYITEHRNVEIDLSGAKTRGCTVTDFRDYDEKIKNVDVVVEVNREKFVSMLTDAFKKLG